MKYLNWVARIILFLVVLSFAVRNTDPVSVRWLPGLEAQAPLVIVILFAFLAGLMAAWLILLPSWFKARRGRTQATKALAKVEKEKQSAASVAKPVEPVAEMPALPVGPTHGI